MNCPAVILGSAFTDKINDVFQLKPQCVKTRWGSQTLYFGKNSNNDNVLVLYRHGLPHKYLPNQINYRAMIDSLKINGCTSLLVTSSVGVINNNLPLFKPLLLTDILMLDNKLPDGTPCTFFTEPSSSQGHLVLNEGLFSKELSSQIKQCSDSIFSKFDIVFSYNGGPRTKTTAENKFLKKMGIDVNSMTLAPEVVLANEAMIPCVGLGIGHKYSGKSSKNPLSHDAVSLTLENSKLAMEDIVIKFLENSVPVEFRNILYKFE